MTYKTAYPELPFTEPAPGTDYVEFSTVVKYLKEHYSEEIAKAVFAIMWAECKKDIPKKSFMSAGGNNYAGIQTDNKSRWKAPGIIGQFVKTDIGHSRRSFAIFKNHESFIDFMASRIKVKGFNGNDGDQWTECYIQKWWSPKNKMEYIKGSETFTYKLQIYNTAIRIYNNI